MTKQKKIKAVILVILILSVIGIIAYRQLSKKSDKYETLYPWMAGWSDKKKDYFKLYRFRAVTNWYIGSQGLSPQLAQDKANWHWEQGDEKLVSDGDNWPNLWKAYREIKNLDENGF